jgi:large subunit ribosomal protein L24
MAKFHVKRGDLVVVVAGSEKGKRGKILQMHTKSQRATIEGLKLIKKHVKRSQDQPQGAIVEREGTVHVSNLADAAIYDERRAKRDQSKS